MLSNITHTLTIVTSLLNIVPLFFSSCPLTRELAPILEHRADYSVSWSFTGGRTPWTGDQLVPRPLPKHRKTRTHIKHPCPRRDSNPKSRPPSDRRPYSTLRFTYSQYSHSTHGTLKLKTARSFVTYYTFMQRVNARQFVATITRKRVIQSLDLAARLRFTFSCTSNMKNHCDAGKKSISGFRRICAFWPSLDIKKWFLVRLDGFYSHWTSTLHPLRVGARWR
jgi:hypothetical protein